MSGDSLLLTDPDETGKRHIFHDVGDDTYVIETRIDAEPIVDLAHASRQDWPGHFRKSATLAATIPMILWQKLKRDGILDDPKAFQRWLNDHPAFKTTAGNAIPLWSRK